MSDSIKLGGDPQELSREEQFESCALIRGPCLCRDPFRSAQAVRQCVMCCPGWIREKKQRKVANQAIGVLWLGQYGRSFSQASQQSGDVNSLTGISWEVHSGKVYTASSLVGSRDCLMGQTQPASWLHCNPALNLRI
ncbi:hypothetical protein TURU_088534 [Turdus rufiventris]|nr:hypothetical protein TURU_088534 [Turdus rufiventris]